jgi:(p)ppGpp synthase/HD superfamily hydrolase
MENGTLLLATALDYAARMHTDQRRKGANREPYINHLAEVSVILAEATSGQDANLVAAGLLHDTVEDTDATYDDLNELFGKDIADLVQEVTDDKSLPKDERKRLQIAHAPHKSDRAKMLKIADKISNLRSILETPPADWTSARKIAYFDWAKRVVDGCRRVNEDLDRLFDATYDQVHTI